MSGPIYMAASGAEAQRIRLQILANNIANINTAGYKEDRAVFRVPDPDADPQSTTGEATGSYPSLSSAVIPMTAHTDFSQGPLQQTGNPLDLAIVGEGFFAVQTDQGIRYTRNGALTINTDGYLATSDGDPVLGEGGEITIDGRDIRIDAEGNVLVDGAGVDKLRVVTVSDPTALRKMGKTLFELDETLATVEPADSGGVQQGFLEGSNVNPVKAMTEMIETQRGYESYQKMIQTSGELASRVISGVGTTE